MATPKVTFFPVGNGDMTLIELDSGRKILIDINIRKPAEGIPDVATDLRDRLKTDEKGRPYVDVMVLSHPDQDHCRGLEEHFHMGPLDDYSDKATPKKIVILEMWSSPLIFRRSHAKNHNLCEDAKAWNSEARRRVKLFREQGIGSDGDRILVLSEDKDGKTDDLVDILVRTGDTITHVAGHFERNLRALLLAPMLSSNDEEEEVLSKNESSVVMNYSIGVGTEQDAVRFLSGGDAEVAIWEKLWDHHKKDVTPLQYDLLSTPHHCSWHSLSYDSWSEKRRKASVSEDARNALSQARAGAYIVASSQVIKDDDNDPPCIRAKEEYLDIVKAEDIKGEFFNTGSYPSEAEQDALTFEVTEGGPAKPTKKEAKLAATAAGIETFSSQPLTHG